MGLWIKRFRIFYRRFILALIILLFPFVIEIIVAAVIPSETNLINSIRGTVSNFGSYDFTLKNYTKQNVPFYVKGSVDTTILKNHISNYFSNSRFPNISFKEIDQDNINEHVLSLRKQDLRNMLNDYYVGMRMNLINESKLSVTGYFSSMAFHSSANIINEIDNFLLSFYSDDLQKTIRTENVPLASNNTLSGSNNYLEVLACLDSFPVSLLNFFNSIIVAFMIGIMVIHVGRERINGSKQLQMLSGLTWLTYWISNFLFDILIHLINISLIVIALKIVDAIKNDESSEIKAIAGDETLGHFYFFLLISIFSWTILSFVWSFLFKSEIIGFVVLVIILGFAAFLDTIWTFLELLIQGDSKTRSSGANFFYALRIIFALVFPNVTVKRALYNLKIRSNKFCINAVNNILARKCFFFLIFPLS